jgi:hypothetical protein
VLWLSSSGWRPVGAGCADSCLLVRPGARPCAPAPAGPPVRPNVHRPRRLRPPRAAGRRRTVDPCFPQEAAGPVDARHRGHVAQDGALPGRGRWLLSPCPAGLGSGMSGIPMSGRTPMYSRRSSEKAQQRYMGIQVCRFKGEPISCPELLCADWAPHLTNDQATCCRKHLHQQVDSCGGPLADPSRPPPFTDKPIKQEVSVPVKQ